MWYNNGSYFIRVSAVFEPEFLCLVSYSWDRDAPRKPARNIAATVMKCLQLIFIALIGLILGVLPSAAQKQQESIHRQRISINEDWSFYKYDSISKADKLIYDVRPEITDNAENKVADAKPTEAVKVGTTQGVLKPWILSTGNRFIKNSSRRHIRPEGNPGGDFPFVQNNFNDNLWEKVNLPHDWAIKGPFQKGWNSEVGGGMGRLPVNGVAWYRKKLDIPASDAGKSIFLDIDGNRTC